MDTVAAAVMDNITKLVPTSKLPQLPSLLAEMCLNCFPGIPEMLQKPVLEEEREGQQ